MYSGIQIKTWSIFKEISGDDIFDFYSRLGEMIYSRRWFKVYGTYYFEVLRYRQRIPNSVEIKRNEVSCTSSLCLTGICNVYIG